MKEEEIRQRVKALREFYMDMLGFVLGNGLFILIWFIFDSSGTFWPKYIFLVWAIALVGEAYRRNIINLFSSRISFLAPEWEEEKVSKMIGSPPDQHKIRLSRDMEK